MINNLMSDPPIILQDIVIIAPDSFRQLLSYRLYTFDTSAPI